jgi:hypothetical protein
MEPRRARGSEIKAQVSPTQILTSNGKGELTEVKAACNGSQTKDAIPETTVVQPCPIHADCNSHPAESVTFRGDHRSPRQPPHQGLCRVDASSSHYDLHTPNRRMPPKGSYQNRYPLPSRVRQRGIGRHVQKAVRLSCWNADGVRGRNLQLEHSSPSTASTYETHLEPGRAQRFANYVCHRTDRSLSAGGIDHYVVPVSGLQHLEATAIHAVLVNRPEKVMAACILPTLTESDLTRVPDRELPCIAGERP